jgi:hypothetical protein
MKAGKLYMPAPSESRYATRRGYRIQSTGEYRAPRAGEWFISGDPAEGYYAPNDLTMKYYIGRRVKVRVTQVVVVIGE